jgi:hypothetical protein
MLHPPVQYIQMTHYVEVEVSLKSFPVLLPSPLLAEPNDVLNAQA